MENRGIRATIVLSAILFAGALAVYFFILIRVPIKYAVRIEDIDKYSSAILVREAWHTGTGWEQVGDASGYFDNERREDVYLIGNYPPNTSVGGEYANIFLCQVRYIGSYSMEGSSVQYKEYEVLEWYPIYPVKRNTILPSWFYPDEYLTRYDMK